MKHSLLRAGSASTAYTTLPSSSSATITTTTTATIATSESHDMSTGILSIVSRFWHTFTQTTYFGDYIGLILLGVGNGALFSGPPFHRLFKLSDPRIQFPFAEHERVPVWLLLALSIGIPLGGVILYSLVFWKGRSFLQVSLLGVANSHLLASFITDFVKQGVGRPRPDLISRCKPKEGTPHDVYVSIDVCTETGHHRLQDGFRSFPSGHSSTSFGGLFYLTLFLAGQLHVLRPGTDLIRGLLALASTLLAAYIALSRIEDYRHDYADIAAGSWIGIICAYVSYRRYFPALMSARCAEPYKRPIEGSGDGGYEGLKGEDEEDGTGRRRASDIEMGRVN